MLGRHGCPSSVFTWTHLGLRTSYLFTSAVQTVYQGCKEINLLESQAESLLFSRRLICEQELLCIWAGLVPLLHVRAGLLSRGSVSIHHPPDEKFLSLPDILPL